MAQSYPQSYSGNKSESVRDKVANEASDVVDRVENVVKTVAERGKEVGGEVQAVAGNLKGAIDTSVREQPMATLAMAAAIGFVVGALWKS